MLRWCLSFMVFVIFVFANEGFVSAKSMADLKLISVKEALDLKDDARVMLRGKIKSQIKSEHYIFIDENNDTIEIEIDDDKWHGVVVDENTHLQIVGKIDKDFFKTSVDVKSLEVLR
ncbi:YgiW/YdeI family stress tolerance OB fold protein [Campylobacter majalis]|uniref:YgiW/YdeI family stress tolerance OB fold protein n=1 Tax=Campylobacter majalis TaxID=2790656 RepID=UPI003D681802